tara:strand:+ start:454 stop:990 length:537 start_codon:yes stop_codon:yes gene_type:complete
MTESEVLGVIEKIANRYCHKFKFGYFTADDIKQEVFIIASDALDRYDESRPLENFLSVHVKNRLSNFKRDNFCRQKKNGVDMRWELRNNAKKYLMEPLDISNIRDEHEKNMREEDDIVDKIFTKEVFDFIDAHLSVEFRADYLRIRDGVYVPKPRREQIYEQIILIMKEQADEEGQIF